jgi:hypothetical protein
LKLQVCRTPNTGHNFSHKQGKFLHWAQITTSAVELQIQLSLR